MIDSFTGKYAFLSNYAQLECPVILGAIKFSTVEAAFQAAKTFDIEERRALASMKPGEAKRAGKKVALRPGWNAIKNDIMLHFLRQKFHGNPELAQALLDTGQEELIEGNTWGDQYWGVCQGKGENWLGRLLMQVRAELAQGDLPLDPPEALLQG